MPEDFWLVESPVVVDVGLLDPELEVEVVLEVPEALLVDVDVTRVVLVWNWV
jgi:hypothetical protein